MSKDVLVVVTRPLCYVVLGTLLGLALGWRLWMRPQKPVTETSVPAIALPRSNAQVLARTPGQPPSPQIQAAAKELGRGVTVLREVNVRVKPKPLTPGETACKEVSVDLGLVKMPDNTERVIARSDDGGIVAGIDIPIAAQALRRVTKWAAGGSYDPLNRTYGAFVDRDLGPFRVSAELRQQKNERAPMALVRVGVRF